MPAASLATSSALSGANKGKEKEPSITKLSPTINFAIETPASMLAPPSTQLPSLEKQQVFGPMQLALFAVLAIMVWFLIRSR